MAVTSKTVELIKYFEGLHDGDLKRIGLQPKMCPSGVWTEGYGRAMRDANGKFIKGELRKSTIDGGFHAENTIRCRWGTDRF